MYSARQISMTKKRKNASSPSSSLTTAHPYVCAKHIDGKIVNIGNTDAEKPLQKLGGKNDAKDDKKAFCLPFHSRKEHRKKTSHRQKEDEIPSDIEKRQPKAHKIPHFQKIGNISRKRPKRHGVCVHGKIFPDRNRRIHLSAEKQKLRQKQAIQKKHME
jgi:hypothetical protein